MEAVDIFSKLHIWLSQYAIRLETLLKKSKNNQVFEEISKDFDNLLSSDEFKQENERTSSLTPLND